MEFDTTTFVLEIVNFLVLAWLLQRLLYKPVAAMISARQASIAATLSDAQSMRAEAEALKHQFDHRMGDWEKEKALAREELQERLAGEREGQLAKLKASLDEEATRQRGLEEQRFQEQAHRQGEEARAAGGRFVAHLLARLGGAQLEERIRQMLLDDLPQLPANERAQLQSAATNNMARITSAFPLAESQRAEIANKLKALTGQSLHCEFVEAPALIAGFRISLGPWVLRANLQDELQYFVEASRVGI